IHYNARGNDFYENHLFAERIGDQYQTSAFKDEIFETVFLGRGKDVPASKEIESGVLVLTPETQKNEESDYKLLRGMITACLEDIESLSGLSLGEGDLFGRIASVLQRHNGLLFARLSYGEGEVVDNSENQEVSWKYLVNSKEDEIDWITVKGTHIPIKEGETKEEVIERFLKDKRKETPKKKDESEKRETIERAKKNEQKITSDIKEITKSLGGKNAGLDFRLKTSKSAIRKVKEVISENIGLDKLKDPENMALGEMWDLVRYTAVFTPKELVSKGGEFLNSLKTKGYKIFSIKNTWLDDKNRYKGINVKIVSPDGQKMELQFHTEKNLAVKEKMHKVYEEYREETSQAKKEKLDKQMGEIGKEYEKVDGITDFPTSSSYSEKFREKGIMKKVDSYKGKKEGTYDYKTGEMKTYSRGFSVTFHQNQPDEKGKYKSHYGRYTEDEYDKLTQEISEKYNADVNIGVFDDEPEVSFHVETFKDAYKLMKLYNQASIWSWQAGDVIENEDYDAKKNPLKGA
ncbi:MAG: hypothetical protein UE295_05385, partial [Acutalibacteraceae bacterium]|nr:hypothetical protein [Acutalibacteraceae bacterium]